MNKQYYTAGEIARIAGVSLRTIRFYDTKGLLPPISYSESGYRYYDKSSVALLQRILMLKYLGFSLEQIQQLVAAQEADSLDQETILAQQKSLLLEQKKQLELLISTIELAQHSCEEDKWQVLVRCLNLLTREEKVLEQYQNPENLNCRINIHAYSTSSQNSPVKVLKNSRFVPSKVRPHFWVTLPEAGFLTAWDIPTRFTPI